ncbi:MAG: YciI family protein, partial [Nocardioidaceae bacterium]
MSEEERQAVNGEYIAIGQDERVTGGAQLQPAHTATTMRVQDGRTLTTDGPFAETKEVFGGYYLLEAD